MDWKIELLSVPVTDLDRAKAFYTDKLGFNPDHDVTVSDDVRFVQLTPPGSACSIMLDLNMTQMEAGSQQGIQVVVASADQAREQLVAKGVDASDVQDYPWGRFVFFSDPDGNGWSLQELPARSAE
jgi:catechol 2,3-dioxygenase-like lactoylglutathione lyase family enzyme